MSRSLFAELKRRNVLRAGVLYIGAVWAFGQGLSQFSPAIGLPDWATRWFLVAAVIGFPFWIHADARWLPFLRKIGKTPEQLATIEFKVTPPAVEGSATSGGAARP